MNRIPVRFASILVVLLAFGAAPTASADETGMGKPGSNQTSSVTTTATSDCDLLSTWLGLCGTGSISE